ncbi:hypothetical protein B5C34_13605 [Pacificimonas flava]|uniref:DUF2497 domain-containing protein n=2 Tax=Pacificimonas TaxID=1960290 RepID=A0A219B7M0_9SPHN|nr:MULTISPECIES: DUF2497 domain-containing protein [Pacificimonas]MBZ6379860.1 DUF2497 domain-containing protein [Pacificimonas aurantium]OWV34392.1 hypothetical protein B5C34_13605 [Pacificimonas flava]
MSSGPDDSVPARDDAPFLSDTSEGSAAAPAARQSMREILSSIRTLIEEGGVEEARAGGPVPVADILGSRAEPGEDDARTAERAPPAAPTDANVGGRTVEELAMELLQPMLKRWMDQHLHGIVERAVAAEVRRVTKR